MPGAEQRNTAGALQQRATAGLWLGLRLLALGLLLLQFAQPQPGRRIARQVGEQQPECWPRARPGSLSAAASSAVVKRYEPNSVARKFVRSASGISKLARVVEIALLNPQGGERRARQHEVGC